jgi:hypothetical protein
MNEIDFGGLQVVAQDRRVTKKVAGCEKANQKLETLHGHCKTQVSTVGITTTTCCLYLKSH